MAKLVPESSMNSRYTWEVDVCPVDYFHAGPIFLVIDREERVQRFRVSDQRNLCGTGCAVRAASIRCFECRPATATGSRCRFAFEWKCKNGMLALPERYSQASLDL